MTKLSADLACGIVIVHFRLGRGRLLGAVHLNIFTLGASWTSFGSFGSFFLGIIGAIGRFVIRKRICLRLVRREFRRCGGFGVPDRPLATYRRLSKGDNGVYTI